MERALSEMEDCRDFLEYLGPDASTSVLLLLDDLADLVRISAVSRSWRRFVIANGFCKKLCLRMWPEVSNFTRVVEVSISHEDMEVGSSSGMEWESLVREHRIFTHLSHCLTSSIGKKNCLLRAIAASSTDNFPDESITNTLIPSDRIATRPSYWSSGGQNDPQVSEMLFYRLCSNICVVSEIKIQPFEAFFQYGSPIYSAKAVRFRLGHSRLFEDKEVDLGDGTSTLTADENYIWTYVSPEFPMVQQNTLQSFKLPRPVICIGGIIQVELMGRVQRQEMDNLYYICVCHVQVIGRPLSPVFGVEIPESPRNSVLQYFPNFWRIASTEKEALEDESVQPYRRPSAGGNGHVGAGGGWLLNALLGTIFVADDDSDEEEQEV